LVRSTAFSLILLLSTLAIAFASPTARAATPVLAIVSPTDGSIVDNGTPVIVRFVVSNFTLVQPGRVGQGVAPNEGHANAFVDSVSVRLIADPEPFGLSLSSGPHMIRLQLVASDGAPLVPDVSASMRVVATQGPAVGIPKITIVSPRPLDTTGHGVYVTMRISNFTLVEPHGQPNAPNEGHVQLVVSTPGADIVAMELLPHGSVLLVALPDGDITITARLVNNDGSPLTPDASASVPIKVTASTAVSLPLIINGGMTLLLAFVLVVLVLRRRNAAARNRRDQAEDIRRNPGNKP
jgi:hypothetical protein